MRWETWSALIPEETTKSTRIFIVSVLLRSIFGEDNFSMMLGSKFRRWNDRGPYVRMCSPLSLEGFPC
jgi:hypothetical protein